MVMSSHGLLCFQTERESTCLHYKKASEFSNLTKPTWDVGLALFFFNISYGIEPILCQQDGGYGKCLSKSVFVAFIFFFQVELRRPETISGYINPAGQ